MKKILAGAALILAVSTGFALAEDAPFTKEIKARQGLMNIYALNIGILAGMAKGETPYDAAQAKAAADAMVAANGLSLPMLWPVGSDNSANPATAALPAIWAEGSDIGAKATGMVTGVMAMQAAAGVDLASLQGAMEGLGGACGACHKAFRASN